MIFIPHCRSFVRGTQHDCISFNTVNIFSEELKTEYTLEGTFILQFSYSFWHLKMNTKFKNHFQFYQCHKHFQVMMLLLEQNLGTFKHSKRLFSQDSYDFSKYERGEGTCILRHRSESKCRWSMKVTILPSSQLWILWLTVIRDFISRWLATFPWWYSHTKYLVWEL
jgi:hypothetical protein